MKVNSEKLKVYNTISSISNLNFFVFDRLSSSDLRHNAHNMTLCTHCSVNHNSVSNSSLLNHPIGAESIHSKALVVIIFPTIIYA